MKQFRFKRRGLLARAGLTLCVLIVLSVIFAACSTAPALSQRSEGSPVLRGAPALSGLHVSGNRLVNSQGKTIILHGVNRSGTEYACIQGWGIFDGPSDAASIQAMKSWGVNAVRVPLNEDCWLDINGVSSQYGGVNYRSAIINYVKLLNQHGMYVILDLHWATPGSTPATGQGPMPDEDHTPAFWKSVAATFKGNTTVLFDLFNEPYPDNNAANSTAAWQCWRSGGACPSVHYAAAGFQQLVNTVRAAGAQNVIMIGGIGYAGSLAQWLTYMPSDPLHDTAASWHVYSKTWCATLSCWNSQVAPVMQHVPVIVGEMGETDCKDVFINPLMNWLDSHSASYLAWAWDTASCARGPSLITDYNGTPTAFGIGIRNHFLALAR